MKKLRRGHDWIRYSVMPTIRLHDIQSHYCTKCGMIQDRSIKTVTPYEQLGADDYWEIEYAWLPLVKSTCEARQKKGHTGGLTVEQVDGVRKVQQPNMVRKTQ